MLPHRLRGGEGGLRLSPGSPGKESSRGGYAGRMEHSQARSSSWQPGSCREGTRGWWRASCAGQRLGSRSRLQRRPHGSAWADVRFTAAKKNPTSIYIALRCTEEQSRASSSRAAGRCARAESGRTCAVCSWSRRCVREPHCPYSDHWKLQQQKLFSGLVEPPQSDFPLSQVLAQPQHPCARMLCESPGGQVSSGLQRAG